ncbi:MAG: hypothetical protein COX57_08735 [Alphaproteobacteria bacterium CG_4_10_14_0_2_um_filter_63_37]|nr:MAG: hypothetical protein COX57_08735 [Alphaproteobacteria bacterium CG_4_10_14_0_2_um_filter_63_37]
MKGRFFAQYQEQKSQSHNHSQPTVKILLSIFIQKNGKFLPCIIPLQTHPMKNHQMLLKTKTLLTSGSSQ